MGSVFGLVGNKYGWMVEVDLVLFDDYGIKYIWLGCYCYEVVGIRV